MSKKQGFVIMCTAHHYFCSKKLNQWRLLLVLFHTWTFTSDQKINTAATNPRTCRRSALRLVELSAIGTMQTELRRSFRRTHVSIPHAMRHNQSLHSKTCHAQWWMRKTRICFPGAAHYKFNSNWSIRIRGMTPPTLTTIIPRRATAARIQQLQCTMHKIV